ncbi:MAG: outer membrane beta-barrel protein [Paludibacteraceae bacterium]|nr:outer membrane beta-barrel protein [Paludibacteraceae bacterium]
MKKVLMLILGGLLCSQAFASGYNRLYAGFSLMSFDHSESENSRGAHLGYLRGINLTKDHIPLFLQFGGEADYVTRGRNMVFYEMRDHYMSVAVPINVSYKIGNGDVTVEPFAGINLRGNIICCEYRDGTKYDFFDEFDVNRFQFGLNVGVGVNIKRIYVGYKFNPDLTDHVSGLTDYASDNYSLKSIYHHFSLGFNF